MALGNYLYLLAAPSMNDNSWGGFRSIVVVAPNLEAAKAIHPRSARCPIEEHDGDSIASVTNKDPWAEEDGSEWEKTPETVIAQYLGYADRDLKPGTILCKNNVGS